MRELLDGLGSRTTLRFIDLRCGTDPRKQHMTLVLDSDKPVELPIDEIRRACRSVNGLSFNLNPGRGSQVLRGAIKHAWGEREVWVDAAPVRLRVSPGSFFQVNLHVLPL